MAKRREREAGPEQRAAEVLAGKDRPSAADLAALIRLINPTDRSVERSRRDGLYAVKSRLQSLLLCSFPGQVQVTLDPSAGEEVLLLSLPSLGVTAGHVPLLSLDEEARSLARGALDQQRQEEPSAAARGSLRGGAKRAAERRPPAEGDFLARGRAALEEYDFDEARRCLEEACRRGGGAEPAVLLLELLVDTLALDEEARAFASTLDGRVRHDERVRLLTALALARLGEVDEALARVLGRADPPAARVFSAVAEALLSQGELTRAAEVLEHGRRCDPSEPAVAAAAEALCRARVAEREQAERDIERMMAQGSTEGAEKLARELAARDGASAVARRVLAEAEERARQSQRARLEVEVASAEAAGALELASGLARERAQLAPGQPDRAAWLSLSASLETRAASLRAEAAAARALARQPEGLRAFLSAYAELDAPARSLVRARSSARACSWVDRALPEPTPSRLWQVVDAAVALERALGLPVGADDEARSLLARHQAVLEGIDEARSLDHALSARAGLARAAEAAALLDRARGLVDQGAIDEALALLDDSPSARSLDEAGKAERDRLRERAWSHKRRREAREQVLAAIDSEDWQLALRGRESLEGEDPALCEGLPPRDELLARLSERWCFAESKGPGCPERYLPLGRQSLNQEPVVALSPDGERAVLIDTAGEWLFLWEMDAQGAILRRVRLRAPSPLELPEAVWLPGRLFIVASDAIARLDQESLRPLDFWTFAPLFPGAIIDGLDLAHDGRHAWAEARVLPSGDTRTRVVDLGKGSLLSRKGHEGIIARPVLGAEPPLMASVKLRGGVSLFDPAGRPIPSGKLSVKGIGLGVFPLPELEGTYLLVWYADQGDDEGMVRVSAVSGAGESRLLATLPRQAGEGVRGVGFDSTTRHLSVIGYDWEAGEGYWLDVLSVGRGGAELVRSRKLAHDAETLSDAMGKHLRLLVPTAQGLSLRRPDDDFAELDAAALASPYSLLPGAVAFIPRAWAQKAGGEAQRALDETPLLGRAGWVASFLEQDHTSPQALLELAWGLEQKGAIDLVHQVLTAARALPGGSTELDRAWVLSSWRLGRSGEVPEATVRQAMDGSRSHDKVEMAVVLADGAIRSGDLPRAAKALSEALEHATNPPLLRAWVEVLGAPGSDPRDGESPLATWLRRAFAAVCLADQRLAAGDGRGALDALEVRGLFDTREAQVLARHVKAWLLLDPRNEPELTWATLALAAYVETRGGGQGRSDRRSPIPGATWDEATLADLEARARVWLGA